MLLDAYNYYIKNKDKSNLGSAKNLAWVYLALLNLYRNIFGKW